MKINELRIGNYVGFKNRTDFYAEVIDLSYGGGIHIVRHFSDGTEDDQPEVIEDITPIPLTEEWLLKFGFELLPWGFVIKGNEDKAVLIRHSYKPNLKLWVEVGNGLRTELKYVHQLQNLFFALTGTELEIK